MYGKKVSLLHIKCGMVYFTCNPTSNGEVKETFFVFPTSLLCLLSLCFRHVIEDVFKKARFELFVLESRVTLARRVIEQ